MRHAFLDSQYKVDGEVIDIWDVDDLNLLWSTADSLGVSVDAVTEHVREWCLRFAPQRYDGYFADPYRADSWQSGEPVVALNHRAGH
jgi:hypothetical protein